MQRRASSRRNALVWAVLVGFGCSEGANGDGPSPNGTGTASNSSRATSAPASDATGTSTSTSTSTSTAELPAALEGLVATIEGRTLDFRTDMLTYNGRPPTMDVSAGSEDPAWLTLRVFVAPDGQGTIVPGEHACGVGQSWIMLIAASATYVSYEAPGTCTVQVIDAGVERGEIFSGTFSGTLVKSDGSSPLSITEGTFYGVVD